MLTLKRLDNEEARAMIAGATEKARQLGVAMCIAVTDESGNLIAFERMDGAKIPSVNIAIDKAYTATGTRKGTHELGEASQPGMPVYGLSSTLGGRMLVIGGGLPVLLEGEAIGGIGVSSGTPAQDQAVAEAGIEAFRAVQQICPSLRSQQ